MKQQLLSDYLFLENLKKSGYSNTCSVGDELFNRMKTIVDKYIITGSRKKHHIFKSTIVCKVLVPFPWNGNMCVSYDISYVNHKDVKTKAGFNFDGSFTVRRSVNQPNFTKITNVHYIKYRGFDITIKLTDMVNPEISIQYSKNHISTASWSTSNLREELDNRINKYIQTQRFWGMKDDFKKGKLINFLKSEHFAYARIKEFFGEMVAMVYMRNPNSPTGVELLKTVKVDEWEVAAKATNNSHQYLVGSEKW